MSPAAWGQGVWWSAFSDALRARTPESIEEFIQTTVPKFCSLLCNVCSEEGYKLILKRHPNKYREIFDHNGENYGMYLWLFDLKNDVNLRLGKPILQKHEVDAMWAPLLSQTTEMIEETRKAALSPETMPELYIARFHDEEEDPKGGLVDNSVKSEPEPIADPIPLPPVRNSNIPKSAWKSNALAKKTKLAPVLVNVRDDGKSPSKTASISNAVQTPIKSRFVRPGTVATPLPAASLPAATIVPMAKTQGCSACAAKRKKQ